MAIKISRLHVRIRLADVLMAVEMMVVVAGMIVLGSFGTPLRHPWSCPAIITVTFNPAILVFDPAVPPTASRSCSAERIHVT